MKFAHHTVQAGFIWLTALTTLFTNLPHFDCICPNGDHKPFCVSGLFTSPDCCRGSCCSSSTAQKSRLQAQETPPSAHTQKCSCCRNGSSPIEHDGTGPGSRLVGNCCRKTLVQNEFAPLGMEKTTPTPDGTSAFPQILHSTPLISCVVSEADEVFFSPQNTQPPPIDLVIALQHILI
jgi:hypothetical protein